MGKDKIAIIGAGHMAKIIADKARTIGVETHCFAWKTGAVAQDSVDVFHDISIFELEKITEICKREGVRGVIATTELTVAVAGHIADALKVCGNPQEVYSHITQKQWVRQRLSGARHLKQPEFLYLKTAKDSVDAAVSHYPVIVKPVAEGGKRGITVADNSQELFKALEYAFDSDKRHSGVLIEEYLSQGCEFSVESLSFAGKHQIIQITQKISSGPPHCVELGHSQPASITDETKREVIAAVTELLDCVDWQYGPTHTEIKIIDGSVYLIELNARPGGDHIAYPLTELSTGYDYIAQIIFASLGKTPAVHDPFARSRYAGVRFVTEQTKELKSIFDHCNGKNWLYEKHIETNELKTIDHNDGCHINYFIYVSDTEPDFTEEKE